MKRIQFPLIADHTFVKKLTEKLKTGHEPACKWRSNPTPGKNIENNQVCAISTTVENL